MNLGIEPPKGVLLFGPPGTGKTLCARAVANRTDACFIRVIGSELVQKYVGEVSDFTFKEQRNDTLNSKPIIIELLEGRCRKGSNRGGQQSPQQ